MAVGELLSSLELEFVGSAEGGLEQALKEQMRLHRGVTFVDLLKFLYQSALGPFHIFELMDEVQLRSWIARSVRNAEPSDEPLVERLYGETWVRLNLGVFKKRHGDDVERILGFLMSAKDMERGRVEEFETFQKALLEAVRAGRIRSVTHPSLLELAEEFVRELAKRGYPPIHHSKTFAGSNNYEYLVVPRASVEELTRPTTRDACLPKTRGTLDRGFEPDASQE